MNASLTKLQQARNPSFQTKLSVRLYLTPNSQVFIRECFLSSRRALDGRRRDLLPQVTLELITSPTRESE